MNNVLSTVCDKITVSTGLSAGFGHPNSTNTQIVLWPWRISSKLTSNLIPRRPPLGTPSSSSTNDSIISISVLIVSRNNLDNLIQVDNFLHDNPVINVSDTIYQMRKQDISPELQVAIFSNSSTPLQPVWSYVIEG